MKKLRRQSIRRGESESWKTCRDRWRRCSIRHFRHRSTLVRSSTFFRPNPTFVRSSTLFRPNPMFVRSSTLFRPNLTIFRPYLTLFRPWKARLAPKATWRKAGIGESRPTCSFAGNKNNKLLAISLFNTLVEY